MSDAQSDPSVPVLYDLPTTPTRLHPMSRAQLEAESQKGSGAMADVGLELLRRRLQKENARRKDAAKEYERAHRWDFLADDAETGPEAA